MESWEKAGEENVYITNVYKICFPKKKIHHKRLTNMVFIFYVQDIKITIPNEIKQVDHPTCFAKCDSNAGAFGVLSGSR